jgi:Skp family chaperone for outer membrane proteins
MIEQSGAVEQRGAKPGMMKAWTRHLLVPALLAWAGTGEAGGKIGVVDVARVMRAHPDTAEADALLEKQLREFELEQEELLRRGAALKEAYETARDEAADPALSDEGRARREDAALEKRRALRLFEKEYVDTVRERQKQLTDQEHRMRGRIIDKVEALVEAAARADGYALVLDAASRAMSGNRLVLFHSAPMEITDNVIARIGQDAATAGPPEEQEQLGDDGP